MTQKSYFGSGTHTKLDEIIHHHSPKKIFLVTGKKSFTQSGASKTIGKIVDQYDYLRFSNFEINPKIEDIKKGNELFKKSHGDFIIGVGGGSVLDMAKAISILASQKNEEDVEKIIKKGRSLEDREIPSVLIPTTAGTGSESTHFSVIYIDKVKYSLAHESMIPDYAILDPVLTESMSPRVTATTGIDAICQAIESFWSVKSTDESRTYSKKAMELLMPNIIRAVNNPDKNSREKMLEGSNFSGKAINIARTTAAHAISYPMTSYYNVPHGNAVALTLPYLIVFNFEVDSKSLKDKRGIKFVRDKFEELLDIMDVSTPSKARDKFISIMKNINLETSLSKLGIDDSGIELIIRNVSSHRMKNNPRILNQEDIRDLLRKTNLE